VDHCSLAASPSLPGRSQAHARLLSWWPGREGLAARLEPDPRKNRKVCLWDRLGRKCTVHPDCRRTSDWFMIACLRAFTGNTNRNPLVQFKENENKQDLLAREVAGAQISSYLAHRQLEVPEIKWVWTNNYKFRSVHFHLSLSPRPSFRFSEGLVWDYG